MTLVAANLEPAYDSRSQSTTMSFMRAQNASEQAKKKLLVILEQKERQTDQLRLTVERKRKHLQDAKEVIKQQCEQKERDEAAIRSLREEKLLWRVFKQLDQENKNAVTLDNICNAIDADGNARELIDDRLFLGLPTTYHITLQAKDFSEDQFIEAIISEMGFDSKAIELESVDNATHGTARITMRLAWSAHPSEIAEDSSLTEEENEQRRAEVKAYYESLGGDDTTVQPSVGRSKEEKMLEVIQLRLPEITGWKVSRVHQELRATFADFLTSFWFVVPENELPEALKEKHHQAKIVEAETILPEEVLDRTIELEHAIKHQQKLKEEVVRDTALTEKDIQAVDKQIDAVARDLANIQRITGFDSAHTKRDHVDFNLQEDEIRQIAALVKKLDEEHRTGQQILRKKTQLIEVLVGELEEKSELEEQVYKAMNDLKVAKKEIDDLMEETRALMTDHNRSDRAIISLDNQRDTVAVQSLQSDKAYLQREIANHVQSKGETDRIIKAQAFRLGVLDNRLSVVTNALKDLKSDQKIQRRLKDALALTDDDGSDPMNIDTIMRPNEVVDVELYELLHRDLEAITTSMKLKDIILLEKEATIEATELKLEELQREKEDDEEYYYYTANKDVKEVEALRHQHRVRQQTQRRERDTLKRGVVNAREHAAKVLKQSEA
ncbi:hypothetical protein DIPPA_25050 [Diplonema papillatum]|nr:hypothetical protein DIPPA_25050 [Diplonema papillatum]